MIASYEFAMTTRSYFGNKCVKTALIKERKTLGKRVLLVSTGRSLIKLGYQDELVQWIREAAEVFVYDKITANPDVAEIREAVKMGKEQQVSSVVGFGGGSAIDAAKAAAVGIASEIDIEEYLLKGLTPPENTLPIIAIPTTSGTGAELSKGAIISSREKRVKSGIRGERVTPTVAIVDPTYTFSLPMGVTMETGFDVFSHAAESYCCVNANPFSEMLSEKAICIVGEALPRLFNNLKDEEAREMMSYASHIMGYNVKNIGNCLPHRLQYPIGVETETSHGAGLIALYPAWIKYEHLVNPERIERILEWLGCKGKGTAAEKIREWQESIKISCTITELGNTLSPSDLANMVTGNLRNDKLADIPNIVNTLYEEAM